MTERQGPMAPWFCGLGDYCHFLRRGRASKERLKVKGEMFSFGHVRLANWDRLLEIQVQRSGKTYRLEIKFGNKQDDSAVTSIYNLNTSQLKFQKGLSTCQKISPSK